MPRDDDIEQWPDRDGRPPPVSPDTPSPRRPRAPPSQLRPPRRIPRNASGADDTRTTRWAPYDTVTPRPDTTERFPDHDEFYEERQPRPIRRDSNTRTVTPIPNYYKKGGAVKSKNFIKGAIKKPGALRSALGAKKGQPIPKAKVAAAAKAPGKLGQRARFAQTLAKMKPVKRAIGGPIPGADGEVAIMGGGAMGGRRAGPMPPPAGRMPMAARLAPRIAAGTDAARARLAQFAAAARPPPPPQGFRPTFGRPPPGSTPAAPPPAPPSMFSPEVNPGFVDVSGSGNKKGGLIRANKKTPARKKRG